MSRPQTVAYFGPPATFTHQAAFRAFGQGHFYLPADSIEEVFDLVEGKKATVGVVPVENSNEGAVAATLDRLVETTLTVTGEVFLPVRLFLLARVKNLAEVKVVYSHPQPLAQSRIWRREHLPAVRTEEARSTSEAAARASREEGVAAVAGELAAHLYGLSILAQGIEDRAENVTRFLLLSREGALPTGNDKTSLVASIPHRPGGLYHMLRPFAEGGVNMTRIESRPSKRKAWEYLFFIDCSGHRDDPSMARVLDDLAGETEFLKVLGSYPVGAPPQEKIR